jgi:phage terminase small subunit
MEHAPPPRYLPAAARELWRHYVRTYELEPHEAETLRLALVALDRADTARRSIRRLGMTYEDRFGAPHSRPEIAIEREARRDFVRLMAAEGFPSDEEPPTRQPRRRGQFSTTPRGKAATTARRPQHG